MVAKKKCLRNSYTLGDAVTFGGLSSKKNRRGVVKASLEAIYLSDAKIYSVLQRHYYWPKMRSNISHQSKELFNHTGNQVKNHLIYHMEGALAGGNLANHVQYWHWRNKI